MSRDLNNFLDRMDATREERVFTSTRPDIWQCDGFRREWYAYVGEWIETNSDWR